MIQPKQATLIKENQPIAFGIYEDLIQNVDTSFFDTQGLIAKRRRTERKTWIFFGVYSPDLMAGFAIADAGMVATAFSYFYSLKDGVFVEDKITVPLGFATDFNPNLESEWKLKNYSISTKNGVTKLEYNGKFKLIMEAVNNANGVSIVAPSNGNRPFNFTYKNQCVPVKVQINNGGVNTYAVSGNYGSFDFTKGYPPRETIWNWFSCIGKTETDKPIALNIVDKFNNNMENILWLDKQKYVLSNATFSIQPPLDKNDWIIETTDGIISCHLTPSGARKENINALVMKSFFTQPFGRIDGTVTINGVQEKFTAYGVVEDHHAVW